MTKQDIDSFINGINKLPSIDKWGRRDYINSLKAEMDDLRKYTYRLSKYHIGYCYGVLYDVDRKNIEKTNDINLFKYLSKLMLYTLNGETDNSWLEDKYKEYHDKYDFSKDKVFTSTAKVKTELEYFYRQVNWTPSQEFIDSIQKEIPNYVKNKNTLINTIWKIVDFIQNKKRDEGLYKTLVRILCLELSDSSSSYDVGYFIGEIKNTFEVDCSLFTDIFDEYFKNWAHEKDIINGLKDHPSILEMLLDEFYSEIDDSSYEDIESINELQTSLNESIDSILVTVKKVYSLLKEDINSRKDFISGFQNGPISKLTENYVGGYIVSHINHKPIFKLIQAHQKDNETIDVILNACKSIGIQKHFYNEYKKIMGVSYTNRFNSSAAKKIKGVEGDNRVVDELRVIEIKPPAEKVEQTIKFDTEISYVTDFQKIKLQNYQKDFLKKDGETSIKLITTKEGGPSQYENLTNLLLEVPTPAISMDVKKDPRKEAYIKGVYLGIVRELVNSTKDLILSSYNKNLITTVLGSSVGDVIVSAVLVELLPSINLGAKKEFIEKVVELLRLNVSVAVGEFATGLLLNVGKELAKDNKLQELVKQVVTV